MWNLHPSEGGEIRRGGRPWKQSKCEKGFTVKASKLRVLTSILWGWPSDSLDERTVLRISVRVVVICLCSLPAGTVSGAQWSQVTCIVKIATLLLTITTTTAVVVAELSLDTLLALLTPWHGSNWWYDVLLYIIIHFARSSVAGRIAIDGVCVVKSTSCLVHTVPGIQ